MHCRASPSLDSDLQIPHKLGGQKNLPDPCLYRSGNNIFHISRMHGVVAGFSYRSHLQVINSRIAKARKYESTK